MPKLPNPGKETLLSFLEEVEKDKLAHPRPDNAKKLGAACKAHAFPGEDEEDEEEQDEDVVDTMNKKTGIDFKKTKNSEGQMDEAAFSRQHYQAIAQILKSAKDREDNPAADRAIQRIGENLEELFKKDNPQFSSAKFLTAAGLEDTSVETHYKDRG